jgi:hypothetical protein
MEEPIGILPIPDLNFKWKPHLKPEEYVKHIKPRRKQYGATHLHLPIVIDAGSEKWRAGWANESEPLCKLVIR